MLYSVISRFDSLREITSATMMECRKFQHLGIMDLPRRSTLSDANSRRNEGIFGKVYMDLYLTYKDRLLSDSPSHKVPKWMKRLQIIDSTTVSLFSNLIFKGVGRNPKTGKKKAASRCIPSSMPTRAFRATSYTQDGAVMEGKAPVTPLLGSNYDGSFIAGIAQLRYIYSMPVERIVKLFQENGFDMDKGTAHGLLRKTESVFGNLYKAMGLAVKEDDYLAGDETYHRVLVKVPGGKNSKKGYIWVVTAVYTGLVYYFYHDGSRAQDVILNYIGDYGGTFQSDGFSPYRKMARMLTRLACLQHVKRKFLDCEDDEEAQGIVGLINGLYQNDHKHTIGKDGWTAQKNLLWRRKYAPKKLKEMRERLDRMAADPEMLPKSDRYNAVHYMLNEWDAIENIFTRGDYHLDNNLVERLNRYISLSRRNSLFFGSHKGAQRAAMFYSLACSCRLNNVNFFEYVSDVINKTALIQPNTPIKEYRNLLPDQWKAL